jgi:hypothetical protein
MADFSSPAAPAGGRPFAFPGEDILISSGFLANAGRSLAFDRTGNPMEISVSDSRDHHSMPEAQ